MNRSETYQKIRLAEEFKRDSRGNEGKWYWQGVIDGLYHSLGQPDAPFPPKEGDV